MYTPVHTRVAGSGIHLPSAPHTALILPAGINPGLHLKNISVSSSMFSMEPLSGVMGVPQLTAWKEGEGEGEGEEKEEEGKDQE